MTNADLLEKYAAFCNRPRVPKDHFVAESLRQVPGVGEPVIDPFMAAVTMPKVRELIGPGKAERAIDVGCGYGNLTMMLCEKFEHVNGIDQCENKIEWAREHWPFPALSFFVRDITGMVELRSADLVHTSTVIQHLNMEDTILALRNIHDMLLPGGLYVAHEGRLTFASEPDELSKQQTHMFAKPLQLWDDLGFRLMERDGVLHVWRRL